MKATHTLHGHRHSPPGQHEHEFEPEFGLPEALPAGEHVLWQGSPGWTQLAVRRFHVRKLVIYFSALLLARIVSMTSDGLALGAALKDSALLILASVICIGLVLLIAWFTARTTVYTLTDRRMVMRIGIVLTITLNLPFKRVASADLKLLNAGFGDLSLKLLKPDHIAYLHLWPHARAWRLAHPEPTLLCIPDASTVAQMLTTAWQQVQAEKAQATTADRSSAATVAGPAGAGLGQPLASH
jgi:hypothetical protein